jgi:hypothetical protein
MRLLEVVQSEGKVREREREREMGEMGLGTLLFYSYSHNSQEPAKPLHPLFMVVSDVLSFTPSIPMGFAKPLHPAFSCSGTVWSGYQALTRLSITCQSVLYFNQLII